MSKFVDYTNNIQAPTPSANDIRLERVKQLRDLLRQLKGHGIISKYEVTKEKANFNRCVTGDKYTVKVEGLTGDLSTVLPYLIRAYLPYSGAKMLSANTLKMHENVDASLRYTVKVIDPAVAIRVMGRLIDVCLTTPATNDGRRDAALQHVVKSYL